MIVGQRPEGSFRRDAPISLGAVYEFEDHESWGESLNSEAFIDQND